MQSAERSARQTRPPSPPHLVREPSGARGSARPRHRQPDRADQPRARSRSAAILWRHPYEQGARSASSFKKQNWAGGTRAVRWCEQPRVAPRRQWGGCSSRCGQPPSERMHSRERSRGCPSATPPSTAHVRTSAEPRRPTGGDDHEERSLPDDLVSFLIDTIVDGVGVTPASSWSIVRETRRPSTSHAKTLPGTNESPRSPIVVESARDRARNVGVRKVNRTARSV